MSVSSNIVLKDSFWRTIWREADVYQGTPFVLRIPKGSRWTVTYAYAKSELGVEKGTFSIRRGHFYIRSNFVTFTGSENKGILPMTLLSKVVVPNLSVYCVKGNVYL